MRPFAVGPRVLLTDCFDFVGKVHFLKLTEKESCYEIDENAKYVDYSISIYNTD